MRIRSIKKQVWLNKEEATMLKKKAKKVGLSESELMRNLIIGYEPKEKPGAEFYEVMRQLRGIGNNLNQIARKANSLGFIDYSFYKEQAEKWDSFIVRVRKEFLLPQDKR